MAKKIKKRELEPDVAYGSVLVSKLINYIMKKGKKNIATNIVYDSFKAVEEKTKRNPVEVFEQAINNASPILEIRARRIGGANYQVPVETKGDRRVTLAFRWIIAAARSAKGKPMKDKLAFEIMEAANNAGAAVRKKENMHKMAEANRAFAHFA
ncbi:MAG: 30S ribosomal protein S7 [Candidatus Paceibacterota bacterium]|jgi:small subunit ribosomal protein S7|nr:30S ribosomal protein S7 [Candidatus Paceibacterota bacterium]MDD5621056.1 30S ribosomal protein S7 [Candidatus Paceibacterota bacterium]